jgi:ornithine cyclodeaminase/alanine dehydrogenase-like protein (mu-crystallin family)
VSDHRLLYLSYGDVANLGVTMADVIGALELAFREKGQGNVEMPPKPGVHPGGGDNFIHAMPAYIPGLDAVGVKWVSGYTENYRRNLPYVNGLLILNDVETGLALSVMDCVWITAMRTGAATAVAARYLARPDSSTAGILGCGVQGRTNLEAFNVLFPLQRAWAYDVRPEVAEGYAREMSERLGLEVRAVAEPRSAVAGCDLVVTAGPILKHPHATIQAGWLEEGAFASLVDYDSYWQRAALKEASKFCTDDLAQLLYYQRAGYFQDIPPVYADLGELVTGQKPGRETREERTITANLGLALGDIAVAPLVYKKAVERGTGTWLPL